MYIQAEVPGNRKLCFNWKKGKTGLQVVREDTNNECSHFISNRERSNISDLVPVSEFLLTIPSKLFIPINLKRMRDFVVMSTIYILQRNMWNIIMSLYQVNFRSEQ